MSSRTARGRLAELEAQASVWRRDGAGILQTCIDWTTVELDVLAARRVAEQADRAADRRALLERERDRLAEARACCSTLSVVVRRCRASDGAELLEPGAQGSLAVGVAVQGEVAVP